MVWFYKKKTKIQNKAGEISENKLVINLQPTLINKILESFGESICFIDEINRGNLPRIFGELLNLFEYRDEEVTLSIQNLNFHYLVISTSLDQ